MSHRAGYHENMRAFHLAMLLIPLALLSVGQVVMDRLGGEDPTPRYGAEIRYTDPPREGPLYPVNVNNWWGLMSRQGDLVVYPRFDWIDYGYENLFRAVNEDRKTGFVLSNGDWRIEPQFEYADRFEEGFAIVGDGEGRFGYIDKRGALRVPIRLDGALRFHENVAAVMVGDKVGFIDARGKVLIAPQFRRARSFHDGRAMVETFPQSPGGRGMLGYVNKRGRWVFRDREGRFRDLGDFHDGYAKAKVGDFWGYIDGQFQLTIEPRFQDARDFVNGAAAVKERGRWGYINKRGDIIIEPRFDEADDFDDILAMVKIDGKYGYIDKRGVLAIPAEYKEARPFFRHYARLPAGGLAPSFVYLDVAGRPHWDAESARRGFVNVRMKEDVALRERRIDKYNRQIPPPSPRPPQPEPYPSDHLYEEVLPPPPEAPPPPPPEEQP